MKIWRRKYNEHGYNVIEEDINNYILDTYNESSIQDIQGFVHNIESSLVKDNELIIVID